MPSVQRLANQNTRPAVMPQALTVQLRMAGVEKCRALSHSDKAALTRLLGRLDLSATQDGIDLAAYDYLKGDACIRSVQTQSALCSH